MCGWGEGSVLAPMQASHTLMLAEHLMALNILSSEGGRHGNDIDAFINFNSVMYSCTAAHATECSPSKSNTAMSFMEKNETSPPSQL